MLVNMTPCAHRPSYRSSFLSLQLRESPLGGALRRDWRASSSEEELETFGASTEKEEECASISAGEAASIATVLVVTLIASLVAVSLQSVSFRLHSTSASQAVYIYLLRQPFTAIHLTRQREVPTPASTQ